MISYKDENHRIKRLEQMKQYYYKKKQDLLKDFKITIKKEKTTIYFN